jgi:NAD(P)-dependent dehydrogenase (short-subunit alcohol dehydrogenase family)
MDSLFSVTDQVVLVSGGTRGIGRAIAAGFAARGAKVVITGREAASTNAAANELSEEVGTPVVGLNCDVAIAVNVRDLIPRVLEQFGRIDTLVNVAGVNRRKPALEVSEEDYDFILDTNLKGAFLLAQQVGRHMVERKHGSQINIASLNTDRPLKNVLPYAMSKAGIAQMTRGLALEWGGSGVRVNGIAPGFILTDLTKKLWSEPTMQAWNEANCPQQRLGRPEDLVGAAVFLASPAAGFITGQTLYVDGGFTAGWSWPIPPGGGQKP